MKEIKEYKLVGEHRIIDMNKVINRYISTGWQPYGSPFYSAKDDKSFQAVVKCKED